MKRRTYVPGVKEPDPHRRKCRFCGGKHDDYNKPCLEEPMTPPKKITCIKIDVATQQVYGLRIPSTLEAIYGALECDIIEIGARAENGDVLFIDEEGLLREPRKDYFRLTGYRTTFCGHGLMVGEEDENGDNRDVTTTIESLRKSVTFHRGNEILEPEPGAEFFAAEPGESMADLQARASKEMAKKNPWRNPPNAS